MRRAGVDEAGVRRQRHRGAGRGVWQAQDGHVRGGMETGAASCVLALFRRDAQQFDVVAASEALGEFEPRRPRLAIDEDLVHGGKSVGAAILAESRRGAPAKGRGVQANRACSQRERSNISSWQTWCPMSYCRHSTR